MAYTSVCLLVTSVIIPLRLMLTSQSLSNADPPQRLIERTKRQCAVWKKKICCLQEHVQGISPLEDLPRDIKLEIVPYLDVQTAIRLTQVNHTWRLLILNNQSKTFKPIWLDTYAVPSRLMNTESPDWRPLLKERWDVITGRKFRPRPPILEKFFHVFMVSAFCGYVVPVLFIFHNLYTYKEETQDQFTPPLPTQEPSILTIFNYFLLNVGIGSCVVNYHMRRIRQDYRRYYDYDENEEIGWKLVHGDVFVVPPNPDFIAAIIGIGNGLMLTHGVLFIAQTPWFLWFRQPLVDLPIYLKILASVTPTINVLFSIIHLNTITKGVSHSYWLVFLTQWLFSVPSLLLLELISRPSAFAPFFTNVKLPEILLYWFVGLLVSGLIGRIAFGKTKSWMDWYRRVNQIRRHIPEYGYHESTYVHAVITAVVAASVFGYFTQFDLSWIFSTSSMLKSFPVVVAITFLVQALISVLVYHQLNRENYWWRWTCVLCGGCFPLAALLLWVVWNWYQVTLDEVIGWSISATAFATLLGAASHDASSLWVSQMYDRVMVI